MTNASFLAEIAWRGLLHQRTGEQAFEAHLSTPGRIGYCGFDPTADSLTIGNLIPIQLLVHWQRAGHRPIVVAGGGTGMIGDPSGKDRERPLLTREQVDANVAGQRRILERLLDFDGPNAAKIVNNADWLEKLGFLEFLRDVGKHFSVNAMVQKESVRERLNNRDQGISYTEFSYMLLQAYDFLHLKTTEGCTVQMAGSDQYGNIVAGIDLIHRNLGHDGGSLRRDGAARHACRWPQDRQERRRVGLAERRPHESRTRSINTGSTYPTGKWAHSCDCSRCWTATRSRRSRLRSARRRTKDLRSGRSPAT